MDSIDETRARALAYLAKRGTAAPAAELAAQVREGVGRLEEALGAVPAAERAQRPAPERWSVQEILAHLVASHEPALAQLEELLAGRSPTSGPVPADLLPESARTGSWQGWFEALQTVHARLDALLAQAHDGLSLEPRAPVTMVVKSADGERVVWIEPLDWKAFAQTIRVHSLEHLAQIERTLGLISRSPRP